MQAFRETEGGLCQLEEADASSLENSLDAAHRLLQHLENQQPRLNALQAEINKLQRNCTTHEADTLTKKSMELDQTIKVPSRGV